MYPFIVCFCGRALGDLYDAFKAMRQARYLETYGELEDVIDPRILAVTEDLHMVLGDVLDMLGLHQVCCRTHMLTQVEFKEIY